MPITFADISKARARLHYEPRIAFGAGISQFVEWYKSRPASQLQEF